MATVARTRDEDIDSELIIHEVEKRPTFFNTNLKEYSDAASIKSIG